MRPEALEGRQLLSGLAATYYDNDDFTGASVSRVDAAVSFNWQTGSPDPAIGADTFSARWVGQVRAKYSEDYTFYVTADDGARLWVNGQLLVDTWSNGQTQGAGKITLEAGGLYDIKAEYHENTGNAQMKLSWESASQRFGTVPTTNLYPPSTPATPAPQLVNPTPGIVNARSYGAMGNGIVDDSVALQKAIDETPSFGTLRLEPRTYKLNQGLVINRPMNLEGNGALLLLNTSANPQNHQIWVGSRLSTTSKVEWTENITAGQSTFHLTTAAGTFTVGQWVTLELGQDPNDPNEQHFTAVVPVTGVTADTITLGTTVPYDIRNGTFKHRITALDSLATQVHIRDVKFDHVAGTIPDSGIWFSNARNSSIDGVSGTVNQLVVVQDSANITVRNANVILNDGHMAAGRVLTSWGSDNVLAENIKSETSADKAVYFLENWTRNTTIRNVDVRWRLQTSPQAAVFHFTGGSYGTNVEDARIDNDAPVMLTGQGGQDASFHFGKVTIRGAVKLAPLFAIDDLTTGTGASARRYANPVHTVQTIDLAAGWNDKRIPIGAGTVKSIKLTVSHSQALRWLFVINAAGKGGSYGSQLLSGKTLDLSPILGELGSIYPFNDDAQSMKSLSIATAAVVPLGARLTVDVEYYPAQR